MVEIKFFICILLSYLHPHQIRQKW